MSNTTSASEDAITESEMIGTTHPTHPSNTESTNPPSSKNAFTTLMSHRKHPRPSSSTPPRTPYLFSSPLTSFTGRNGLGAYIASPTSYPPSRVLYHTENFVVINDLFPKSSIHLLLLPRNPQKTLQHPIDALSNDPPFLASIQSEVQKIRAMAASELRRLYGKSSAQDALRIAAMNSTPTPASASATLPPGRDWTRSIISGIHACPSMSHLHIHILSVDRVSPCMKHRKHYNSFATPFLIPVEDFPLVEGDERREAGKQRYLRRELVCWRCGRGFGKSFQDLKAHLEMEFEEWKKE